MPKNSGGGCSLRSTLLIEALSLTVFQWSVAKNNKIRINVTREFLRLCQCALAWLKRKRSWYLSLLSCEGSGQSLKGKHMNGPVVIAFYFPPALTNGAFPLASHWLSVADLLCHSSHLVTAFTVHAVPMAGTWCPLQKRAGTNHLSFFPLLFQATTSHIVWPCRLKAACLPLPPFACLEYMPTPCLIRDLLTFCL